MYLKGLCVPRNPRMNFCCHELRELQGKLYHDDLDCVLLHRKFDIVVLDEDIFRTALVAMKDVKKRTLQEPIQNRLVAYPFIFIIAE